MDHLAHQVSQFVDRLHDIEDFIISGRVTKLKGLLIECTGLHHVVSLGTYCSIENRYGKFIAAEVIGFDEAHVLLMPFSNPIGIGPNCKVIASQKKPVIFPDISWKGRILNAFAEPIDDKGPLLFGSTAYPFKQSPPPAQKRKRVGEKLDMGVRTINAFLSCCKGQRMGVFSASGVGKSVLIAMLTRYCSADIKVIGLIGERGREVKEFVQEHLGEEGLKHAVVIVATGDETALMRRQAAYLTMAVAEYFRDQGLDVLCLMDSVTRFAMAQREIGLASGEPPTTKGYTPTVFSELPQLLERAGPGVTQGSITGLFSVLVEGDDTNEPVSDTVRGILDGHIIMNRELAARGRLPAVDVLRSVSRMMPQCNTEEQNQLIERARLLMSTYEDMQEMIRIGAYRKGSDRIVDESIFYQEKFEQFLKQRPEEASTLEQTYAQLKAILRQTPPTTS